MNREIKFRAWHKELNDMTYSFPDYAMFWHNQNRYPYMYELMQFTGLLDRHGKEIYEGDIVKTTHLVIPIGVIKYWDVYHSFEIENGNECIGDKYSWSDIEIIGNIYEHKKLLK